MDDVNGEEAECNFWNFTLNSKLVPIEVVANVGIILLF